MRTSIGSYDLQCAPQSLRLLQRGLSILVGAGSGAQPAEIYWCLSSDSDQAIPASAQQQPYDVSMMLASDPLVSKCLFVSYWW
jgi:hypothetical protein